MTRSGETEVMFDTVDWEAIGKVNFVCRDSKNRVWITVSTMLHDWPKAIDKDLIDGRVLLYEEGKGVRIVADDVHFSNECKLDEKEEFLELPKVIKQLIEFVFASFCFSVFKRIWN